MSVFRRLTEVSGPSMNVVVPSHGLGTQMNKSPLSESVLFPDCRYRVTSCLIVIHCHRHVAHHEPKSYSIMAMRKVANIVTL